MLLKNLIFAAALAFAVASVPSAAFAQAAPTQQSATHADAAAAVATSASTGATLTLTPQSGQSVYITGIEITNCAGSSAVSAAAVTSVTTTNLGGAAWTVGSGVAAGLCQPSPASGVFALPLKAAAPGAVTVVLPTFATNQTVRVQVYWYSAL